VRPAGSTSRSTLPDAQWSGGSTGSGGAAGEFTIYPNPDTDPTNPQKTRQYIPVRIQIMNSDGMQLLPG